MVVLSYEKFLKEKSAILIDVRSPKEFEAEPIPGAVNVPILDNDERAAVGTAYKQVSPEEAKRLGMNYISKKLPEMFEEINNLSKEYKKLVFYCARGGMRSSSVTSLFSALGYKASKLDGGYKSYRQHVAKEIPHLNEGIKYVVLHGRTGIGKTKVLQRLEERGYSVLDLEKFADHKGSFYGALCESREQSQKRFESEVLEHMRTREYDYFLVESESKRIGNVYVPESIFQSMTDGYHVLLETSMDHRVEIIMEDYAKAPVDEMLACTTKLRRYLKEEDVVRYEEMLKNKEFALFSRSIMEEYYDPLYQKSINKYDFDDTVYYEDLDTAVEGVINFLTKEDLHKVESEEEGE